MSSEIRIQSFFRCPHCRMPHEAGTITCPETKQPIGSAAIAMPAVVEETDVTMFLPRMRPGTRFVDGWMLDGKYRIGARVGAGAKCAVYRALHVRLERWVAIKVLAKEHAVSGPDEARLVREGKLAALVRHPNVVTVHDLGVIDDGWPYVVTELLEGETIAARIARAGRVHASEALHVARATLSALSAVHARGMVHRDVRPVNVFLHREHDRETVRLIDFGLAIVPGSPDARREKSRRPAGSPAYLSPEVLMGQLPDPSADLWALGISLYEMLTGQVPFPFVAGDDHAAHVRRVHRTPLAPPSSLQPDVPPMVDDVVMALLERDVAHRWAEHGGIDRALEECQAGLELAIEVEEPTYVSGGYSV